MTADQPCALVTGAGRGFGRAIANKFHSQGYTVVATDYDGQLLADLENVPGWITATHDVTSPEHAAAVAQLITEKTGRLDVIVNNAGVNAFFPLTEAPPQKTINGFMINTFGPLIVTQACLDLLIASKGRVLNISSESAPMRPPFQFYQASKASLEALSDSMRRELQLFDVHVATVRPGAIMTQMTDALLQVVNEVENSRYQASFDSFSKMVVVKTPKNKMTPEYAADQIFRVATDPRKKPLYKINNSLDSLISALLPRKFADKMIRRMLASH